MELPLRPWICDRRFYVREAVNCVCHGEPAYWQRDVRKTAGGRWECRVKRQAYNRTRSTNPERRDAITQRRRDKYDADPVFRLGKLLHDGRRRRLESLTRRREAFGALSQ